MNYATIFLEHYTESEQSLYRFFGICGFIAAVPLGITETKRKMLRICLKFQYKCPR